MPAKTITVNNGDGSTKTITIPDRSRFAGVRTMTSGHVYPKSIINSTSGSSTHWSATETDGSWQLVSTLGNDSTTHFGSLNLVSSSAIRVGKHRIEFEITVNSGTIDNGASRISDRPLILGVRDYDDDPSTPAHTQIREVVEGSNTYDVEVFDDGINNSVNYNPLIFLSGRPHSVFDITVSNIKVTHNYEEITVNRTAPVITSDRKGASRPLLSKLVGGASGAYSLRDLNDKAGNNKVVEVRRSSGGWRKFSAKEVSNGTLVSWVGTSPADPQNITSFTVSGITNDSDMNGTYSQTGTTSGKAKWEDGDASIMWMSSGYWRWQYDDDTYFTSHEGTTYPWDVTTWSEGDGSGTPTFGSFVGGSPTASGGSGFVSVWYDQSGNDNDAIQPINWLQPKIVIDGSLVKDTRNNPALYFEGDSMNITDGLVTSGAYSCIAYHETDFSTMLLRGESNAPRVRAANNGYQVVSFPPEVNPTFEVPSTKGLVSVIKDSSHNARVYADGVESSSGQKNVGSGDSPFKKLVTNYGNGGANGKMVELIYYPSDHSANRPAIEANINNQYDIY